ncbi:uS10/mL48 family ribosomal protein [Candidatus Bathyarchaeota archaeon]|nr:uS10/mL48 family ribosomal protein [Candidatus Bathyarchaeota archaeon]
MSWPAETPVRRIGFDAPAAAGWIPEILVCSRDTWKASPGLLTPNQRSSEAPSRAAKAVKPKNANTEDASATDLRYPKSVQALYLRPLRRETEYGIPSCDLQLRSYSVRTLEFFADFALRAAYYLNLPAFGPVPLPRIIERWTVPKSSFIFKKSQENFERITLRRLVQIRDGNPETVQVYLAFLQKHAYAGVGMKANMWEFSKLGQFDPPASLRRALPRWLGCGTCSLLTLPRHERGHEGKRGRGGQGAGGDLGPSGAEAPRRHARCDRGAAEGGPVAYNGFLSRFWIPLRGKHTLWHSIKSMCTLVYSVGCV